MKASITIRQTFVVEIDGKPVNGEFKIAESWEGMVKLSCDAPVGTLIIERPSISRANIYDLIPKMLGGNCENGKELKFEAEVIRAECGHIRTATTKEFKRP